MIKVVAAFIEKDNKVLIAKRSTGDKNVLGKWEFPGGKVKEKELEETAIKREIKEELNIEIKAISFITNVVYKYPKKTVDLRLYKCEYISGEIKLYDHSDYIWIEKEKILDLDLAPADIPLAKFINN